MRTFRSNFSSNQPIIKRNINNAWLCRLTSGSINVLVNFEKFEITSNHGQDVFFIVHDGQIFSILDRSAEYELQVHQINQDTLLSLYPLLGSEANFGLNSMRFVSSENMKPEITEMLSLDYQLLFLMSQNTKYIERDKMLLHILIHIYLTFYNGIGKVRTKSSRQSFNIINRFYELFCDNESFRHRDTKYFADRLNITVRYLFQICKDETDKSPKDLINETIISEISHLILNKDISFQQISLDFNFPDQTSFTQFFKRNTGMTPSEFRKKYK